MVSLNHLEKNSKTIINLIERTPGEKDKPTDEIARSIEGNCQHAIDFVCQTEKIKLQGLKYIELQVHVMGCVLTVPIKVNVPLRFTRL